MIDLKVDKKFNVKLYYNRKMQLGDGAHLMNYPWIGSPICILNLGYAKNKRETVEVGFS